MTKINFYNEKGNVSAKVRNAMKAQTLQKIRSALAATGVEMPSCLNECGGWSVPIAETLDGKPIYAHIALTVSDEPVKKSVPKAKEKAPTEEPTVNLFED